MQESMNAYLVYLIDLSTRRAIKIEFRRNFRFATVIRRLEFKANRVAASLSDFPGVTCIATYNEQSPELRGIWFDSYQQAK